MRIGLIRNFFTYIPFMVYALSLVVFVWRCRFKVRTQAIWAMVLLLGCSKFICFKFFGGDAFCPEFPPWLVLGWDALYSSALVITLLAIPLFFWRSPKKAVILSVLALFIALFGIYNGIKLPELREVTLKFANLPDELVGYRIVHISDIHCSSASRRWRTQALVDMVNAANADLICITGDFVDGKPSRRFNDLAPIANLKARDGVWACAGNHEFYGDYIGWMEAHRRLGTRFLANECVFPRKSLALGGINDIACTYRLKLPMPNVDKAFEAATNGEFKVLMQHRPSAAHANLEGRHIDLQLSGHTHGGIAPFMYPWVARGNGGFINGLYEFGDRKLLVSSGAGFWPGFPLRHFTPSEIVAITLSK